MYSKMRRKICVITGTRSEYGLMKPVMEKIKNSRNMELSIIATGMHLSSEFSHSIDEIERDGFNVDVKVDMLLSGDDRASMSKSIGLGIIGITQALEAIRPDIVIILGDRIEPLAVAISAANMGIPIAHIAGGDSAMGSNIDDSIRHAITKFANIHFPATEKHAQRIIKLGEDPRNVHVTGSTGLDSVLNRKLPDPKKVSKALGLDPSRKVLLVVQHPTSLESGDSADQMRNTMEAIAYTGEQVVVLYPNSDAGGRKMIEIIEEYRKNPNIKIFKNLDHDIFLGLMNIASVMIGNSSSGIIEAPSFGLPVVNIGLRQLGRDRAENVLDTGHEKEDISRGIKKALHDKGFREKAAKCMNPYGDGKASEKIVKILGEKKLGRELLQKRITY